MNIEVISKCKTTLKMQMYTVRHTYFKCTVYYHINCVECYCYTWKMTNRKQYNIFTQCCLKEYALDRNKCLVVLLLIRLALFLLVM